MCEICSKLVIKHQNDITDVAFCVVIIEFEHISHIVLVFPLLTLNR